MPLQDSDLRLKTDLAATALMRIFGIRRRRACLGMPTDGGRRNTMWRCTNDRQRGCKMFMGLTTVEKRKKNVKDSILNNFDLFDDFL